MYPADVVRRSAGERRLMRLLMAIELEERAREAEAIADAMRG
ncbi:MAG TPA: hypothetical protein PK003_10165 [Bacillota bacterium]|nr:hypothetical protein [Bacillota bacterium]